MALPVILKHIGARVGPVVTFRNRTGRVVHTVLLVGAWSTGISVVLAAIGVTVGRLLRDPNPTPDIDEVAEFDDMLTSAPADVLSDAEIDRRCEGIAAKNFLPGWHCALPSARKDIVP